MSIINECTGFDSELQPNKANITTQRQDRGTYHFEFNFPSVR